MNERRPVACATACSGFSLMELLMVVAIAALLTMVAVPSYRAYTMEAKRSSAQAALADAASRQEQFFLSNRTYTKTVGSGGLNVDSSVEGGSYELSVVEPDDDCPIASCYILQAKPLGTQEEDSCGSLTYDVEGEKSPIECW